MVFSESPALMCSSHAFRSQRRLVAIQRKDSLVMKLQQDKFQLSWELAQAQERAESIRKHHNTQLLAQEEQMQRDRLKLESELAETRKKWT